MRKVEVKRILIITAVFFHLLHLSVNAEEYLPFELKVEETKSFDYGKIQIKLIKVDVDERCPMGILCYWDGYLTATIEIKIIGGFEGSVPISSVEYPEMRLRNVINKGKYTITMDNEEISPAREYNTANSSPARIDQRDYVISFFIEYEESEKDSDEISEHADSAEDDEISGEMDGESESEWDGPENEDEN